MNAKQKRRRDAYKRHRQEERTRENRRGEDRIVDAVREVKRGKAFRAVGLDLETIKAKIAEDEDVRWLRETIEETDATGVSFLFGVVLTVVVGVAVLVAVLVAQ